MLLQLSRLLRLILSTNEIRKGLNCNNASVNQVMTLMGCTFFVCIRYEDKALKCVHAYR